MSEGVAQSAITKAHVGIEVGVQIMQFDGAYSPVFNFLDMTGHDSWRFSINLTIVNVLSLVT